MPSKLYIVILWWKDLWNLLHLRIYTETEPDFTVGPLSSFTFRKLQTPSDSGLNVKGFILCLDWMVTRTRTKILQLQMVQDLQ